MNQEVWWTALDEPGLEHLRLSQNEENVGAESLILRVRDGEPFQAAYRIRCDAGWRVREVEVSLQSGAAAGRQINLKSDGRGNWTGAGIDAGNGLSQFAGCFEVDISTTPFTNTLPLKRARLGVGEAIDISVVYFLLPELNVQRSEQRYSRLEENLYRFEEKGLFYGFSADLRVDKEALVIDYPNLFRRVK